MARPRRWNFQVNTFANMDNDVELATIAPGDLPDGSTCTRLLIDGYLEYQPAAELLPRIEWYMGIAVTDTTVGLDPVGANAFPEAWMWWRYQAVTVRPSQTSATQNGPTWGSFSADVHGQRVLTPSAGLNARLAVTLHNAAAGGVKSARIAVRSLYLLPTV